MATRGRPLGRPSVGFTGPVAVRIVTDSNTMVPAELCDRFGIVVVPLHVVVDGVDRREDEIDQRQFCQKLRDGAMVTTAAPSPGDLLAAYQAAAADGARAVASIHIGSNRSATVGAARVAARSADIDVTVVDTGTASFIAGCSVWRAAEVLADGGSVSDAEAAALAVAASSASVFTIGELTRANQGGRFAVTPGDGVPVYSSAGPDMAELGRVSTIDEATAAMVAFVSERPGPLRVGVGDADAPEAAEALRVKLTELPGVAEVVRYTVGPSVAAHTGAGTFGAVFHPLHPPSP